MSSAKVSWFLSFSILVVVLLSSAALLLGQAGSERKADSGSAIQKVTVEGELLSEEKGSGAKSVGDFSLKVMRAISENGVVVASLQGQVLRFRETAKSKGLIKSHSHGDKVSIQGNLNLKTRELEVQTFKAAESGNSRSREVRGSESK